LNQALVVAPSLVVVGLGLDVSDIDTTAGPVMSDRKADEGSRGFECVGLDEAATREAASRDSFLERPSAH